MLNHEEYVEQAYFFRALRERMQEGMATQDLLGSIGNEILATTNLPMALEFMVTELRMTGGFATAMSHLPHYFTPFQSYVVAEAERAAGRFDFRIALEILQREAEYRSKEPTTQGTFLFQFETLCRNRLGYDHGLEAIAADDIFDEDWKQWILTVRRQIGIFDLAEMIYVRSEIYEQSPKESGTRVLFGEKEGRVALANCKKDPLYLFSALQRHLAYPVVPRHKPEDSEQNLIPLLRQRVDRLESRLRILEEELRGGINLNRFYEKGEDK
jgi:hypothetical protein